MGKDFRKRNQQHKSHKPYNKNFKNKSGNRGNYVANNDNKPHPRKYVNLLIFWPTTTNQLFVQYKTGF